MELLKSLMFMLCVANGMCYLQAVSGNKDAGAKHRMRECAQGQAYWCKNITTATSCSAVKHCIQAVWEREIPIEKDKSDVCQICLNMVKQARDQLQSNETQEDIKAVLEGSCMLIPIQAVRQECKKLMEDFAVQLVDTLSSQMNPQVVCSVAGLCNNARIRYLEEAFHRNQLKESSVKLDCDNCHSLMDLLAQKFKKMSDENIWMSLTGLCRFAGSYSDGCAALVTENKEKILSALQTLEGSTTCSLAGVCKEKYHNHKKLIHQSISNPSLQIEVLKSQDDLPCQLCTQLVIHLRNVLIANTTEQEFKMVLQGLCNQLTTYKEQCLQFVEQYYEMAYDFLVNELDGKGICTEIHICSAADDSAEKVMQPILNSDVLSKSSVQDNPASAQLPVERLNPLTFIPPSISSQPGQSKDKSLCAMCEYFLHFVQQEITLPSNERKIREVVMKGCDHLPRTVADECSSFVQTYMDAIIALLANKIDPSQVCPSLGVCLENLVLVEYKSKPACPLCLLAMEEISLKVKNNTPEEVNNVLDNLCLRDVFPNSLSVDCVNFVNNHRRAIIDMVLTEFTPQESCVFVDLCIAPDLKEKALLPSGNTETNEISDASDDDSVGNANTCALCEFIMTKIDEELENKKTEAEIKNMVDNICTHLPKTLASQCHNFVTQYADLVIDLLAQELDPKEVCTYLNLCGNSSSIMQTIMKKCLVCELLMDGLRTVLSDKEVDDDINKNLEKACHYTPKHEQSLCLSLVYQLAPQIEQALATLPIGPLVCKRIHLCERDRTMPIKVLSKPHCNLGASYWCLSTTTAALCQRVEYCQQKVWHGMKPIRRHNKGRIVIRH